ncbi:sterol 3-beta-glucosyltransferase [Anaeramoeba flamelloides]|uniref:Sterol 3-beta-glucosyltransferase n=1 Tax=Anaeramoeba flamelloides TaxID=1746091 RepID=A0ABQ8YBV2_9EUKA|nr:sterol 3-beta-glucosyltransferase [Anaeramoeba flamelloides]
MTLYFFASSYSFEDLAQILTLAISISQKGHQVEFFTNECYQSSIKHFESNFFHFHGLKSRYQNQSLELYSLRNHRDSFEFYTSENNFGYANSLAHLDSENYQTNCSIMYDSLMKTLSKGKKNKSNKVIVFSNRRSLQFASSVCEHKRIPIVLVDHYPATINKSIPHPYLGSSSKKSIVSWYSFLIFTRLFDNSKDYRENRKQWFTQNMIQVGKSNPHDLVYFQHLPTILPISNRIVTKPKDWKNSYLTGPWQLPTPRHVTIPKRLQQFLQKENSSNKFNRKVIVWFLSSLPIPLNCRRQMLDLIVEINKTLETKSIIYFDWKKEEHQLPDWLKEKNEDNENEKKKSVEKEEQEEKKQDQEKVKTEIKKQEEQEEKKETDEIIWDEGFDEYCMMSESQDPWDKEFFIKNSDYIVYNGCSWITNLVLAHGKPSLVIHTAKDQFFWGNILKEKKVGISIKYFEMWNKKHKNKLINALRDLLTLSDNAKKIGEQIKTDIKGGSGLQAANKIVEEILEQKELQIIPNRNKNISFFQLHPFLWFNILIIVIIIIILYFLIRFLF